jgi:hypothetical protein
MRKHMQKEAAQEFVGCHRHELLFAAVGVIPPAERYLTIDEVYEPMSDPRCLGSAAISKSVAALARNSRS